MTELELRQKAVAQFKAWLGYSEADGRYRQIVDIYNAIRPIPVGYTLQYSDEWCAATVSAACCRMRWYSSRSGAPLRCQPSARRWV